MLIAVPSYEYVDMDERPKEKILLRVVPLTVSLPDMERSIFLPRGLCG
jgi:hypothetical protein